MKRIKDQLSPALVISVLALFVALGGASYAALGKNSVGAKQLKKNAVVTKKIKKNAVTAAKIKAGAVTAAKIKDLAVTEAKLANNSVAGTKLSDASVSTSKLANESVTPEKLAPSAVGSAIAYATIKGDGTVDPAKSRGITSANVEIVGTSNYCLKGLPTFGTMTVTPGQGLTEFDGIVSANYQQAPFDEGICSTVDGAQASVITYYDDFFGAINPAQSKKPFSVVLFK